MSDTATYELTDLSPSHRDFIKGRFAAGWDAVDRLDDRTYNVTIYTAQEDDFVEYCEEHNIVFRLV